MFEAKKDERVKAFKKVKGLHKEYGFNFGIIKGA